MHAGCGRMRIFVTSLLLAVAVVALSGCQRPDDELQVRRAIESAAQAAEQNSASDLAAVLSEDFDGNDGALDRRALSGTLRLFALRGEQVKVTLGPVGIERRGERLVATFTVAMRAGGRLLPENLGVYQVESAWRKDAGDWLCYSATWTQSF